MGKKRILLLYVMNKGNNIYSFICDMGKIFPVCILTSAEEFVSRISLKTAEKISTKHGGRMRHESTKPLNYV